MTSKRTIEDLIKNIRKLIYDVDPTNYCWDDATIISRIHDALDYVSLQRPDLIDKEYYKAPTPPEDPGDPLPTSDYVATGLESHAAASLLQDNASDKSIRTQGSFLFSRANKVFGYVGEK